MADDRFESRGLRRTVVAGVAVLVLALIGAAVALMIWSDDCPELARIIGMGACMATETGAQPQVQP